MKLKTIEIIGKIIVFLRRNKMRIFQSFAIGNKHVFTHISYYSCTNVGDTVLSDTVRNGFEQYFGKVSWKLHDVKEQVRNKTVQQYNSTAAIIIGGGGLFLPATKKDNGTGWQWICSQSNLADINVPVIIFAVGFNFFRGHNVDPKFISSMIEIINKSAFVGLRNQGSIREISKLIPEDLCSKLKFQPCLTTIIRKLDYALPDKKLTKSVVFNVALDRVDLRLGKNHQIILNEIAKSMKLISSKGYTIYFIAHIIKDLGFATYIQKTGVNAKIINASAWSTNRLINFYQEIDVVIGMRGHAQMIPFGVNCQIITLGSHDKMKWFLEDINALDWYIELQGKSHGLSEEIVRCFIHVHEENFGITNKRIFEAQAKFYTITQNNLKAIKSALTCFTKDDILFNPLV